MLKAFDPEESRGRRKEYDEELLIHDLDPFLSDYLKIIQSKAYRRMAYKTQVLCFPENPHIRTRNLHTNEVIAVSATIAEKLGLNRELCMAIAAGHDLGHTPYGHLGESVLSEKSEKGKRFRHYLFSSVVAQQIERKGFGLNLSYETLEGIVSHSMSSNFQASRKKPDEYDVVMYADKIAYTFSDVNDAIRYNHLKEKDLPEDINLLGENQRKRNNACINALIDESKEKGRVSFNECDVSRVFWNIREFMTENVYHMVDFDMHRLILEKAYDFFSSDRLLENLNQLRHYEKKPEIRTIDPSIALALLTDREANTFGDFMLQTRIPDVKSIEHFGVFEILPYIQDKKIDYTDPGLDWERFF